MAEHGFPQIKDDIEDRSRRRLIRFAILCTTLVLVAISYFISKGPSHTRPQPVMGKDPCDMGFVGVRKDYGDTLFGAQGEVLGFDPPANIFRTHWTQDSLQREFIFEVPVADDSVKIARPVRIYLNGHRGYSPRARLVRIKSRHSTRLIVDAAIPRLSMHSDSALAELKGGEPVEFVDVYVTFYAGPRPPAEIRFVGPFGGAEGVRDELGRGYTLHSEFRSISLETRELRLKLLCPEPNVPPAPLLVYLADGSFKVVPTVGQDSQGARTALHFVSPDISREQVVQVTFGEPYYEKAFNGIAVEYQSRGRSYASFLDAFCERLGIFPGDREAVSQRLFSSEFEDPAEALAVLDVARGRAVLPVCDTVRWRLKAAELPQREQDRVRGIARKWLGTELESAGIALGLWGGWPEFVEPALQQLQWIQFDRQNQRDLADAFRHRRQPTEGELAAVADYLVERQTKSNSAREDLIAFVRAHLDREAGLAAWRRLAECDRPWLWASAIADEEAFSLMRAQGGLSEIVTARALALGIPAVSPPENASLERARADVAQWVTPEFVQKDVEQFGRVIAVLARHGLPERDTPALVAFLREQLRLWNAYKPKPGRMPEATLLYNHVGVEKVVKCLNGWHHLDLAGLGHDLSRTCSKDLCDWRNVARTALHWAETGEDPAWLPAGWRVDGEDLRVIWYNTQRPELSRIVLWSRNGQSPLNRLHEGVDLGQQAILYSIYLRESSAATSYGLALGLGIHDATPTTLIFQFEASELPYRATLAPEELVTSVQAQGGDWLKHWTVSVESAKGEESILSGTSLFEAWKEIYWRTLPAEGRPRTFSRTAD